MGRPRPREGEELAQGHTAGPGTRGLTLEPAGFHIITVVMGICLIISRRFTLSYLCAFTYFVTLHFCVIDNTYFSAFKNPIGLCIQGTRIQP